MTPQEALDWCEQFTDNLIMADVDNRKRTLALQAMQVCKSALEKQIPKKVITSNEQEYCPVCNYFVPPPCEKYCSHCGQALDWSDTE